MKPESTLKTISIILIIFYGMSFLGNLGQTLRAVLFPQSFFVGGVNLLEIIGISTNNLIFTGIISLITSALILIGSVAMLQRKNWGRKTVIWTLISNIIISALLLVYISSTRSISGLIIAFWIFGLVIGTIITAFIIYFLSNKKMQKLFR